VVLVDGLPAGLRACYVQSGDEAVIAVDQHLTPPERDAAIAHERVHHERGGSGHRPDAPQGWGPVVAREEARVEAIVAQRLAPPHAVHQVVQRLGALGEAVTADGVADELGVAPWVAHEALAQLRERRFR
jgi:hypothetical protein